MMPDTAPGKPDPIEDLLADLVSKFDKLSDRVKNLESHEVGLGDVIEDIVLTSDTASFDFQGIPAGWRHLMVDGLIRTDRADITDGLKSTFNADTGANYDWLIGDIQYTGGGSGGAPTLFANDAAASSSIEHGFFPAANAPANVFGPLRIKIMHYQNPDAYKTSFLAGGHINALSRANIFSNFGHGQWRSTSTITRITFTPVFGSNFKDGSRMTLYGLS